MQIEKTRQSERETGTVSQIPIAIIGMAGIFPQAKNVQQYWENILHEVDCITEVPVSRWDLDDYYDPDPTVPDKTYCRRGGFLPDIDFNPMEFGLPPNILEVTDSSQLLSLVVAKQAIEDAGYGQEKSFDRENTGVIDPINPNVETPEDVRDRGLEAAECIPLEQLGTTDDCGFSPFGDDTSTARDIAFAKIKARVEGTTLAAQKLGVA